MKKIYTFVKIILLIIISGYVITIYINQNQELKIKKNMETKKELLIKIATKRAILTEIIEMLEEDEYDIHKRNLRQAKEELISDLLLPSYL